MTKKITNTAKEVRDNPAAMFGLILAAGSNRAIESQESAGQAELVQSEMIPVRVDGCTEKDLEAIGFVLGPIDPSDKLFRPATLPAGWKKAKTDHSMWSKIVDAQGRERFAVFYKAAFYDRDAFMQPVSRFSLSTCEDGSSDKLYAAVIKDCDSVVVTLGEYHRGDYEAADRLRSEGEAWLAERYPDHRNPLAYWD